MVQSFPDMDDTLNDELLKSKPGVAIAVTERDVALCVGYHAAADVVVSSCCRFRRNRNQ